MCQAEKIGELFEAAEKLAKAKHPASAAAYEVGLLRGVIRSLAMSKEAMAEIESTTRYYNQQLEVLLKLEKK